MFYAAPTLFITFRLDVQLEKKKVTARLKAEPEFFFEFLDDFYGCNLLFLALK